MGRLALRAIAEGLQRMEVHEMSERIGKLASRWTAVNGLPMHARVSVDPVSGEYPPVVLVHGLVVSSRYMVPTAVRLAPYCRVYAPDLPGFGKSDKPPYTLGVSGLADALADWMRAVGLERAALLGNSFGCQIVTEFAVRHPEMIEQAVLAGPTIDPRTRTYPEQFVRWLLNSTREPLSLTPILLRDYLDAGFRRALRTLRFAMADHIEERLPRVTVPTLVVRGFRDPTVPQRWAEEATALLPAGKIVVIPGAAHTLNYSAPLELVRVTLPFMLANRRAAERRRAA